MTQFTGVAQRVTIYISELDKYGKKPLYEEIAKLLRDENCAGVTLLKAMGGFGETSRVNPASMLVQGGNAPVVMEWVDSPEQVERLLPQLQKMVVSGLITVEDVKIATYSYRAPNQLPTDKPVQEIMSRKVRTVAPDTPVTEAVTILLDKIYRALPVIDAENRVIGIVTESDLLQRAQTLATTVQETLTESEFNQELGRLFKAGQTVRDIMTSNPVTISPDTVVTTAIQTMIDHNIKRLPVVDTAGHLVGIVSRIDILRAMTQPAVGAAPRQALRPGTYHHVKEVMLTNVPSVRSNASLAEVIGLLTSHTQRRVVVVDRMSRVVGIITDGDLLNHATETERPKIISMLAAAKLKESERVALKQRTAAEVMTTEVITVNADTPLLEALQLLLAYNIKRLPVINGKGKLVGLIGRGGILQALGRDISGAQE